MKQLKRLEVLASFPLASFGPHLVQENEGFQVIACEDVSILSHLVTQCGEDFPLSNSFIFHVNEYNKVHFEKNFFFNFFFNNQFLVIKKKVNFFFNNQDDQARLK
jgi:hypothetical protein